MDKACGKLENGDEEEIGDEGPFTAKAIRDDTEDDLGEEDLVRE